jgi:hypothetical protein
MSPLNEARTGTCRGIAMDDGIPAMYIFSSGSGVGTSGGRLLDNVFSGLLSTIIWILAEK